MSRGLSRGRRLGADAAAAEPSAAGYAAVLGVALAARVTLTTLEFEFITPGQRTIWSWSMFAIFALALAAGAAFAERAGLPSPRQGLRSRQALALAATLGAAVALLTIASDRASSAAAARGLPTLHVPGVAAVPFYLYGAILITVLFHFLPVAMAAWLAQRLPGTAGRVVVVAGVLLVALSEDLGYFVRSPGISTLEGGRHLLSVLANASEGILIYRYGLLPGLLQRGTTYLLWHIAWPNLQQP